MNHKSVLVLYLYVASVCSAPMQLQVLPIQYGIPQLPFWRQAMPDMQSPPMYPQQPLVLILPNAAPEVEADDRYTNLNEQENNHLKSNTGHIDENKDAVVIDANPKPTNTQTNNALVYLPGEKRYSIGQIISYIPFLPIEVNVPETISWIGNVISGWIRPQSQPTGSKRISNKGPMPVLVVPYPGPMLQVQ